MTSKCGLSTEIANKSVAMTESRVGGRDISMCVYIVHTVWSCNHVHSLVSKSPLMVHHTSISKYKLMKHESKISWHISVQVVCLAIQ